MLAFALTDYSLDSTNRSNGLLDLARLLDPGGISRHATWHRYLPLLHRWSTEDYIGVYHGKPLSQGPSDSLVSHCLISIGRHDLGSNSRDVQLWIKLSKHEPACIYAGYHVHHAIGYSVVVPIEISQHQRG